MTFHKNINYFLKKIFDCTAASILLILLTPLMIIIALCVRISLGGPILFSQIRTGKAGLPFHLYKFRSMKNQSPTKTLSDFERLTPFGIFLRKFSLDELPQLINVLKGDLSIVGPRPLLPEYDSLYNKEQKKRLLVTPGITGWAQVNGRNSISWNEKFKFDLWYIDHWSLWLDARIIILTVFRVFLASGIDSGENVTMEKFKGNE